MASLVDWLAFAGARKTDGTPAASGRAYFYVPGSTSTFASVFSDKDGLLPLAVPVSLDASGRAEVYAKTPVHVEVYDAAGLLVRLEDRANTVSAAQVEIENAAATGTDLTTGQQVAGGRTDLNTFLTSMLSSFGAPNGQVLVGGVAQNIKDLLSGSTAVFFSVQNSNYNGGAKGNDSTDDTAAIQAAVNACQTAGGGIVWVPPGTYKITSAIAITSAKVWIMGASPSASIIKQYTASAYCLNTTSATDIFCSNVAFQTGVGTALMVSGAGGTFVNCAFTAGSASAALSINNSNIFLSCAFTQPNATGSVFGLGNAAQVQVVGGSLTIPTATSAAILDTGATVAGVIQFNGTKITHAAATGTTTLIPALAGVTASFVGCQFIVAAGATLNLTTASGGTPASVFESGSFFATAASLAAVNPGFTPWSTIRDNSSLRTSGSAISYSPDAIRYRWHDVTSTGASFVFANPAQIPQSSIITSGYKIELVLRYKNTSGGAITPTFGTLYKIGTAPSVANNACATWFFEYDLTNGVFLQVGGNSVSYAA